jgi:hypothetical protein
MNFDIKIRLISLSEKISNRNSQTKIFQIKKRSKNWISEFNMTIRTDSLKINDGNSYDTC